MDLVYSKYLGYDKLSNDYKVLYLKNEVLNIELTELQKEFNFKTENYKAIIDALKNKIELTDTLNRSELKKVRGRGNRKFLVGAVLGIIGGAILIK